MKKSEHTESVLTFSCHKVDGVSSNTGLFCGIKETTLEVFKKVISPQLVGKLCSILCGHHSYIMDKCKNDVEKALFYVEKAKLSSS